MPGGARSAVAQVAARPDESTNLLDHWHRDEKLPFCDNRWMCLGYSERAMALLDDFAALEITVLQARNLQALSMSNSLEPPSTPYVSVLLDDTEVFQTQATSRPAGQSPRWSHEGSVPFLSPMSMVRLQVKDHDSISHEEDIGFVEFCLADLPWDTSVECWLELRLQDKLESTSWVRYADHRGTADSQAGPPSVRKRRSSSLLACSVCKRAPVLKDDTNTAGEILVRLRLSLRPGCSRCDRLCALALDCPSPEDYGRSLHRSHTLPGYKIQDIGDHLTDLKFNVMENAVFSVFYGFQYVLQWRSCPLSILFLAAVVAMWHNLSYAWVILPGILAVMIILFACKTLRLDMTTGGFNAPLSQEGFGRVALWRHTPTMARFLRRLVEEDLQGKVTDEKKFHACAAHCFSGGRPRVSFAELRDFLTSAEFTSHCQEMAADARVLACGRHAVVKKVEGGKVVVEYEDDRGRNSVVDRHDVVLRQKLPDIPEWALSTRLGVQIRTAQSVIGRLNQALGTAVGALSSVLAWKRPLLSVLTLILLLAASVGNALWFWNEDGRGCGGRPPCFPLVQQAVELSRKTREWLELTVCVFVMIFQALWFSKVRNILKICARLLCVRRNAPSCWAFYRADPEGLKGSP
jgi:hypothetical protein